MPLGCKLPLKGLGSQGGLGSGLNPTRLSSGSSPRRHGRVTKPALTRVTARQSRKRPCFSARGAISTRAWGIAPGNSVPRGKALKARFIPLASFQSHTHKRYSKSMHACATTHDIHLETCESDGESRFQRWRFCISTNPGALPQACSECCAFGANRFVQVKVGQMCRIFWSAATCRRFKSADISAHSNMGIISINHSSV